MGKRIHIMPPEGRTAGLWEQPAPYVLPHSVEMSFVRSMECPFCHSHLLMNQAPPKSPDKVYCPVCGWKPRDVKKTASEDTAYHVYPAHEEETIRREGLKPGFHGQQNNEVFLFRDPEEAQWYAEMQERDARDEGFRDPNGDPIEMRIAPVDITGLPAEEDNTLTSGDDSDSSAISVPPVPAHRVRIAHGYSDDFRTLLGMMKNAYQNEEFGELLQLATRMQITADEMIPEAHEQHTFGNDSVSGHDQLATWMYGQGEYQSGNDLIDKHVKLQHGQFSLPGEIKQQAGFIEQAIINGDLKGFKAEMLQQYVQSALKQFHETGKWQGVWKVLKNEGGEWEQAMDDPQNSMNTIDALFELEMSKSDPIYKKLQTAVHQAESCDRYLQWIEQLLDEKDGHYQEYLTLRAPWQEQFDAHQKQLQEFHDKWNTPGNSLEDVARELGIDLDTYSKTAAAEGQLPEPYISQPWNNLEWLKQESNYHSVYGDDIDPAMMFAPLYVRKDGVYELGGFGQSHSYEEYATWTERNLGLEDLDWDEKKSLQGAFNVIEDNYALHWPEGVPYNDEIAQKIIAEGLKDANEYRKWCYEHAQDESSRYNQRTREFDEFNSKTAAHVDVQISYGPISKKYFGGQYQIVATKDGQDVGVLIIHDVGDYLYVPHTEIAPEYRDTDVFMQLAAGLMSWMRETGNIKPIAMQTIYPGIKNLVDRWNSRFENLPAGVYSELYDIKDVAPGRTDMAWFYSGVNGPLPENLQVQEVSPYVFKAFVDGEDVGRILVDGKSQIHVNVLPQYQRRGIASELLRQLQMTYPEFVPSHSTLISEQGLNWAQQQPQTMWPSEPQSVIPAGSNDWYYYEHGKGKIPQEAYDCPHCGSDYSSPTSVRSVRQCNDCGQRFVPEQLQYHASFDMPPLENPVSYEWTPWTDQELSQWHGLNDDEKAVWRRRSRNLTRGARRRGYAGSVAGRDLWLLNNRYRGNCAYCGQPGADSWDHVKPLSQGGEHTPSNILPAHLQCNYELGAWDDRNRDYRGPSQYTIQNKPLWTMQPAEAKVAEVEEAEFGDPWSPIPKYFYGERVVFRGGQGAGMIVNDEPEVFEGGWWYRVQADDGKTYQAPEEALLRPGESDRPGEDTLESLGIPPEAENYYRRASQMPLEAHQSAPNGTRVQPWALTSGWLWEKQEQPSVSEWDVGQSNEIPEGTNVHDPNLCPTCGREKNPGSDFCPYCYAPYDQAPDSEAQKAFGWHPSQYPLHIPQAWMQTIRDRDMPPSRQDEYVKQWKEPYNSYWTRQTMATPQMIEWLRSQVPPDKKEKFESDLAHFTDRDGQMWGVQRTKGQLDLYDWMWLQRMYGPMDHYGYPKQQAAPPQVFQGKTASVSLTDMQQGEEILPYEHHNAITEQQGLKAWVDGQPAGNVTYEIFPDDYLFAHWLYVEPEYRDSGVMRAMIDELYRRYSLPISGEFFNRTGLEDYIARRNVEMTGASEQQPWNLRENAKLAWKRIEPSDELRNIAHGYMANQGWGDYDPPQDYPDVDPARAKRIADEYEKMEHDPHNPQVRAAYDALMQETQKQYEHLLKHGYQFEFEPQEGAYNSPWDAIDDVRNNKHLYVYPTSAGFGSTVEGDHPLLEDTGYVWNGQPVTYNDLFRGVHDVFGHAKEGVGFRQDGEENAWRQHAAMYSDLARHALTSETRGQNSWVNYGPHGEQNQTADQSNTVYAPQKAGLMADWTAYEGDGRE